MALTTRLTTDFCPRCAQKLDAATNTEFYVPKAGDVSVCIGCQAILQWDEDMRLQVADLQDFPADVLEQVIRIIVTMKTVLPTLRHKWN